MLGIYGCGLSEGLTDIYNDDPFPFHPQPYSLPPKTETDPSGNRSLATTKSSRNVEAFAPSFQGLLIWKDLKIS